MVVLGAVGLLGSLNAGSLSTVVGAVLFLVFGVYLLRGQGVDPRIAEVRAAAAERREAIAAGEVELATHSLATAEGRGATVVAYRNLGEVIRRHYPQEAPERFSHALSGIRFDPARLNSRVLGAIPSLHGGVVEVFADWIIYGQQAFDVDPTTRGNVYLDGSVQTVALSVQGVRGTQTYAQDERRAELQFVSAIWSMSAPIHPDHVNDARRLISQLAVTVEARGPKAVTAADISTLVNTILGNTGQPAAEKLRQLSNLRYERLLSDHEFEAAKARILGI